jgi:hypothetical protein
MELINKIEAKISELENQFKKNTDFIVSANSSIDKLVADKNSATSECNVINGMVQAFRGVIAEVKAMLSPNAEAKPDIQPVE